MPSILKPKKCRQWPQVGMGDVALARMPDGAPFLGIVRQRGGIKTLVTVKPPRVATFTPNDGDTVELLANIYTLRAMYETMKQHALDHPTPDPELDRMLTEAYREARAEPMLHHQADN